MVHPCPGAPITATFRQRGRYWKLDREHDPLRQSHIGNDGRLGWGIHTGLDIGAPEGTPIRAMTHGKVTKVVHDDASYGNYCVITFDGEDWWYCHQTDGGVRVHVGQAVEAGQRIGTVGATGNVSGAHLHIERRRAGGGWNTRDLRDPRTGLDFQPDPIVWQSGNCGQNNKIGADERTIRQGQLLTDLLRPGAHIWVLQECPTVLRNYFDRNLPKRPRGRKQRTRRVGGESGRYIYAGRGAKETIHGGVITPSVKGGDGHVKKATWELVQVDKYRRRLVVNVHGPFGIRYSRKVDYWDELFADVNSIRIRLGLEWWQVGLGGDTNGPKAARKAARRYGLRDARLSARKVLNSRYGTTNGWRPALRRGRRLDLWFFDEDVTVLEYRNVKPRANKHKKARSLTDHNRQVVITR